MAGIGRVVVVLLIGACLLLSAPVEVGEAAQATVTGATYKRVKAALDAVPAIDTHDHLFPFDRLPGYVETDKGRGMTLAGLWRNSYLNWIHRFPEWKPGQSFLDWWTAAKPGFEDFRTTSFYRYTHIAIQDLYGVDVESMSDAEAVRLNERIFENYKDTRWLQEVITEKANIELMFTDTYWAPYDFRKSYPFEVQVLRLNPVYKGFHPSEFKDDAENPYHFARKEGLKVDTLDDYLALLDRLFQRAREAGLICLKMTLAYQRTLAFDNVPKERAAQAFGRPRSELTDQQIKDFEDFIMWRLCELSAKHDLPFQIHTGHARIQGSNPMLLVDLMQANPQTKFILFHGGFPWVGETGMIVMNAMRSGKNVWVDSVWLPQISYHTAKRAFHEWLDVMPSDRIMWGGDTNHAEGIYGGTELTRRVLAEVLAERIDSGELKEAQALRIGRQILRENALKLFPRLNGLLWKQKANR